MSEQVAPKATDLTIGGTVPSPVSAVVLGGIAGLKARFEQADIEQKMELLTDTLNYDATGIDLLIDLLNDAELKVRVMAYELLSLIDLEKAKSAIAQGIRLNPGDHIYHVYESAISYNDCWFELVTELEGSRVEAYGSPKRISSHFARNQAAAVAAKHHFKCAHSSDLASFGKDNYREFDFEQWVIDRRIFARHPQETVLEFSERLRQVFEATKHRELSAQLWHNFQREEFDIDQWFASQSFSGRLPDEADWEFEARIVKVLKALQYDQEFGELWIEAAGRLAFVQEETVTEVKYVNPQDFEP